MNIALPLYIPNCKPIGRDKSGRTLFRLIERFRFYVNEKEYVIPADFVFDGASIPILFVSIFNPSDTRYLAAALIHDWLYSGEYCPRKLADTVFKSAMATLGVPKIKRAIMHRSVRLGGGITYATQHTEKTVMNVRRLSGITQNKRPLWEAL